MIIFRYIILFINYMDNDGGMGERKVTEHTLEEIKDMKELKPNSVEGSKEEVVDAILVEEIEQLDKLDGTRPQEYNEDTFNNTPEGMERLLKSWESISPQEKEVDEELYYIFYDDILNGILPNAINPNFKSPEFEELSNEVFADEFFDEMFRIELRRVLDKKINTNTEGFVNNKAESYMNMFKFFNTQNVETYLKERNFNIDDYAKYLARVDHSFEETFYTLLNYLEAKIKYQKDGDDLMILL
jgi:hypothetical protein